MTTTHEIRKSAVGSISELKVSIYYLQKGWQVFFPHSHDTETDLLITKGPRVKRVQVKTAYQCGDILRVNIDHKKNPKYSPDSVDVLACLWYGKLWIIPMEDVEEETTLNFGRVDGSLCNTRGNFDHTRYLAQETPPCP